VASKGVKLDGEYYEEHEVRKVLVTCSKRSPTGVRDRAYLLLLWQAGLRSFEAIDLLPSDIDFERGTIRVRDGKGGISGTVGCGAEALEAIGHWLAVKDKLGIGDVVNPRVSRRKADLGRRIYPDALPFVFTTLSTGKTVAPRDMREMFKRRAEKAGLERRAHLHGLRHSHAVALDRAGTSVSVTSSQLRHKSLAITTAYLNHISSDQKVAAVSGVFG
jgi:integrase/recombinase XerD